MKPQTIQIFLPDGHPTSIREAEITNSTGYIVQMSLDSIKQFRVLGKEPIPTLTWYLRNF